MQENIILNRDIEQSSIRELSLDEAEAVGGGFSWGGLVHDVEHIGGVVAGGAAGFVGGTLAKDVGKAASWAVNKIKNIRPPKGPGPDDGGFFDDPIFFE